MRDQKTENYLNAIEPKLKWAYVEKFETKHLDLTAEVVKQIRFSGVKPEVIERYQLEMKLGVEFPAITIARFNGDDFMANGIHRTEGWRNLGKTVMDAYVVECNRSDDVDYLRHTGNLNNGEPIPGKEIFTHAAHFVNARGYSATDAARVFGLKAKHLLQHLRIAKLRKEVQDIPGVQVDSLGWADSVWVKLHACPKNLLTPCVAFLKKTTINVDDVGRMIQKLRAARTEKESKKIFDAFAKRGGPSRGPGEETPPRPSTLRGIITRAANLLDAFRKMGIPPIAKLPNDTRLEYANALRDLAKEYLAASIAIRKTIGQGSIRSVSSK